MMNSEKMNISRIHVFATMISLPPTKMLFGHHECDVESGNNGPASCTGSVWL